MTCDLCTGLGGHRRTEGTRDLIPSSMLDPKATLCPRCNGRGEHGGPRKCEERYMVSAHPNPTILEGRRKLLADFFGLDVRYVDHDDWDEYLVTNEDGMTLHIQGMGNRVDGSWVDFEVQVGHNRTKTKVYGWALGHGKRAKRQHLIVHMDGVLRALCNAEQKFVGVPQVEQFPETSPCTRCYHLMGKL